MDLAIAMGDCRAILTGLLAAPDVCVPMDSMNPTSLLAAI
jgi:hypothetical protein